MTELATIVGNNAFGKRPTGHSLFSALSRNTYWVVTVADNCSCVDALF